MFRVLGFSADVIDAVACFWLDWRSRRMIREVESLFTLLRQDGDPLPDLEAHGRLLEALTQRLDAHDGQLQSIGRYMHDHTGLGRLGMHRVE